MAKRHVQETHETYVIEIVEVEQSYMFGLNPDKKSYQNYWEFTHPVLTGKLLKPDIKKITKTTVTLMGDRRLDEELSQRTNPDYEAKAIGSIETRGEELMANISLPLSVIGMILQSLASGQLRVIGMRGAKLKYRRALITSIDFMRRYDPEMY